MNNVVQKYDFPAKELDDLGVIGLYLFGSQAQGLSTSLSDIDVGVLVRSNLLLEDRPQRNKIYDALYDMLSHYASRTLDRLCDIDIVFLEDPNVNFQLRYHVAKYGTPLYERNPRDFANFKERTMDEYADFAPLRRLFTESILARIS